MWPLAQKPPGSPVPVDGRCPGDGAAGDLRGGGTVTSPLLNTCQVCGAEESLDAMLARMIDDGEVRRLIADVVTRSMVLGGHVVRYLRLHKPPSWCCTGAAGSCPCMDEASRNVSSLLFCDWARRLSAQASCFCESDISRRAS